MEYCCTFRRAICKGRNRALDRLESLITAFDVLFVTVPFRGFGVEARVIRVLGCEGHCCVVEWRGRLRDERFRAVRCSCSEVASDVAKYSFYVLSSRYGGVKARGWLRGLWLGGGFGVGTFSLWVRGLDPWGIFRVFVLG